MGAVAGAVLAAGFPPYHAPVLLPLGIAILLTALRGASVRSGAYTGFACGVVYFGATLFWLGNLFGAASISLVAIAAAFPMLFAALFVWLRGRLPGIPVWLLAPALWTGVEYYRSEPFVLNFGWMGLGYGVIGCAPLARAASWVGSYGLTFGTVALGGVLSGCAFGDRGGRPHRAAPTIPGGKGPLVAAAACAVWATLWLVPAERLAPEHPVRVRLVQGFGQDEEDLIRISRSPARVHPDVLVWPEYSIAHDPRRYRIEWEKLTALPREERCWLLFGAMDQFDPSRPNGFRNSAFLLDPDGHVAGRHVKNHPVHFIQDGVAGREARAIPTTLGRLGVGICFDMDYPDVARRLAKDGAEVFLVPNDDPPEWGPVQREQHRLMFRMRAAECGRWLARADVAGGTSVAAPNGVETARIGTTDTGYLDADIGRTNGPTPYVRFGWLVGRVCLGVIAVLCVWVLGVQVFRCSGVSDTDLNT